MHKQTHNVIKIISRSSGTFELVLERNSLEFIPGQCVNIGIPNTGINREYSTYSAKDDSELRFLIREVPDGQLTPKLRNLKPGDQVEIDGAYGLFTLEQPEDTQRRYMFIGTGTGIAPFHSFVKSYPKLNYKLLHGIRTLDEAYDRSDYNEYICCTSQMNDGDFSGRVTDYLSNQEIDPGVIYYLCGNRNMINDVYDLLRENQVSGSNIITETFF